jgi:sortase A
VTVVKTPRPGASDTPGRGATRFGPGVLKRAMAGLATGWVIARPISSTALMILGGTLLGFAAWFAAGSQLYYDRVQHDDYASFRGELALATAPTGPTNPANPTQLLAPGTPVAVLRIPQISLSAVVLEGTNGEVLEGGPGLVRDTALPGQVGYSEIMGRRSAYGGPFARISLLAPGDRFSVLTGQGVSYYTVLDVRRAGEQIPPLGAGQGRLILVTADGPPFVPTGLIWVDAQLTSTARSAPAMPLTSADLSPSEVALGTDTSALIPLVAWGAALVLVAMGLSWADTQWSRWQTWIVAVPALGFLGLEVADQVALLLPNLM